MALQPALRTARQLSVARKLLVALLALALVGTAGGAVLLDHPAAQVGVGGSDWSAFSTVTDGDAYTVVVEISSPDGIELAARYGQFANGSYVESTASSDPDAAVLGPGVRRRSVVQLGDVRYERETYATNETPSMLEPDVYADGAGHVVERERDAAGSYGSTYARSVERTLAVQVYARDGTVTRNGTTFTRYEVVGHRDPVERITDDDGVAGHVLVDGERRIRYAELRSRDGTGGVLQYRASPGGPPSVPGWVGAARAAFEDGRARPEIRAYRHGAGVVLTSSAQWTPAAETTVAILSDDDTSPVTARLPAGEPVFQRRGNDTYVAMLTPTADGVVVSTNGTEQAVDSGFSPERVIVDRRGRNLYDVPIEPSSRLASVYSVTAAHLRPANGGGRVLRVDSLQFGDVVAPETPVTITVGNRTTSRSLTVPARTLSSERFYLLRTADGIEVENAGGIAVHVTPSTRFAERRFVANATLTVTVHGVPVIEQRVPERVTQASPTPLPALLTGVGIEMYDEPPDGALLGQGEELRAMNWTGYTFIKIHSWDYDTLQVTGGYDIFHPDVLHEDQTHYYRASDGARFWVETGNGTRLYEGVANGSKVVSP